jgi:hypothetical protein
LEALAAEARERSVGLATDLAHRDGLPPGPGDLFVLAATAELPVEWAILDRRDGGELLTVPADASPLVGGGDVEIPAGAPGGPLVLRCRFAIWLDGSRFDPTLRTGALAAEAVAEALQRRRRMESGELEASPLAEEVEADPEYQDWIREVPARARELAARPSRVAVGPFHRPWRSWRTAERLAAVLALAALGMSLWIFELRREIDRLSAPIFDASAGEIVLGGDTRGSSAIEVPPAASHVLLTLILDTSLTAQEGRLEIADASGSVVWRSARVRLMPGGEATLTVLREKLPDGTYHVRIVPASSAGTPVEATVRVETEK